MDQVASTFGRAKLLPRTLTAIIGGALFLAAAWAGGVWWIGIMAVLALLAAVEYAGLHPQIPVVRYAIPTFAVMSILRDAFGGPEAHFILFGAIVFLGGIIPWFARGMDPHRWHQPAWLVIAQGIAYVALPLGVLTRWRLQGGPSGVLWFFLVVWAADTAAYFVGVLVGRHKMAPVVSPGKSWEGAAAGLGAGGIAGLIAAPVFGLPAAGGIALGVLTNVAAQIGDLFESALKRRAGVKDSGALLPGHGGVLDRFDAVFFAAPVAYAFLKLWGRI